MEKGMHRKTSAQRSRKTMMNRFCFESIHTWKVWCATSSLVLEHRSIHNFSNPAYCWFAFWKKVSFVSSYIYFIETVCYCAFCVFISSSQSWSFLSHPLYPSKNRYLLAILTCQHEIAKCYSLLHFSIIFWTISFLAFICSGTPQ